MPGPAEPDAATLDAARRRRKDDLLAASSLLRAQAAEALDDIDARVGRVEAVFTAARERAIAWRDGPLGRALRPLLAPVVALVVSAWWVRRLRRPAPVDRHERRPPVRSPATGRTVGASRGVALLSLGATLGPRLWRWARRGRRLWWAWRWWTARRRTPARGAPATPGPKDPGSRSAVRHDTGSLRR